MRMRGGGEGLVMGEGMMVRGRGGVVEGGDGGGDVVEGGRGLRVGV